MRKKLLICVALAAVTAGVYGRTLGFDFVTMDDKWFSTDNPHVSEGLTTSGLIWALSGRDVDYWRPVSLWSHMLDCEMYGLRPGGHHLTNVLLHMANALLLFGLLRAMTRATWRSALVAALFALHPLRVESVVWVSKRKDVISAFLGFLAIWVYANQTRHPHWI